MVDGRTSSTLEVKSGDQRRQPVRAFLHQGHRSGQPPGLEGELRELVALHAVEVHHHPAEAAGGELHLEDVGPLPHQRRLLGEGLLEPDRPGRLPEVAEGPAGDLELGVARVLRQLHLVELPHQVEEVRDRGHAFSGTSSATHSTWWVIGNRSKARRPRERVAVLGEVADVPGQGGRVAGDVRDGARRRRAAIARTTCRLAPARGGSSTTRSAVPTPRCRTRSTRPGDAPRPGVRRAGWPASARDARGRPRPPPPIRAGPDRVGEERGEQPDAGVQVEHRLPRLRRRASRARSRPASRARPGAPARSRRPPPRARRRPTWSRRARRPCRPPARARPGGRSGSGRPRPRRASGACAARARRRAGGRTASGVRQRSPSDVAGTASTTTSRSRPASRGQLLADHRGLERRCSRQRHVLEVAAAAAARAGVRARRRRPGPARPRAPRRRRPRRNRSPSCPR